MRVDENMTKEFPDCLTCTFRKYCRRSNQNCPLTWIIDNINSLEKIKEKVKV